MVISKLDNNSKMIISKYLCGKNFIDFIKAFNLSDYYFTTFNYIIINTINTYHKFPCISKSAIKRIKKTLQLFPNLNEIILNFVTITNNINCEYYFKRFKYYYNKFKNTNTNVCIKFNILSKTYKPYKEIYMCNISINDDNYEFFKNVFEPNVKQNVYIDIPGFYFIKYYTQAKLKSLYDYKDCNILFTLDNINLDKLKDIIDKFNNLKIYYTCMNNYNKIGNLKNIDDIKKHFIIKNNKIFRLKYDKNIYFIKNFKEYYDLFKLKHTNLNYLKDYITNADVIIRKIKDDDLKVINMYKYGVKNIYENILNYNVVYNKLDLTMYINNKNVILWLKCRKIKTSYYDYYNLFDEIKNYIKY